MQTDSVILKSVIRPRERERGAPGPVPAGGSAPTRLPGRPALPVAVPHARTDTTRGDVAFTHAFTVLFRLPQQDERGASPVQLAQARPGGAAERLDLRAVPVARADSECRTAGRAASTDMIWII